MPFCFLAMSSVQTLSEFPVYFDTEQSAASVYNTYSIPVTYFVDADGNLVAYGVGALDAATLQQGIDMILE